MSRNFWLPAWNALLIGEKWGRSWSPRLDSVRIHRWIICVLANHFCQFCVWKSDLSLVQLINLLRVNLQVSIGNLPHKIVWLLSIITRLSLIVAYKRRFGRLSATLVIYAHLIQLIGWDFIFLYFFSSPKRVLLISPLLLEILLISNLHLPCQFSFAPHLFVFDNFRSHKEAWLGWAAQSWLRIVSNCIQKVTVLSFFGVFSLWGHITSIFGFFGSNWNQTTSHVQILCFKLHHWCFVELLHWGDCTKGISRIAQLRRFPFIFFIPRFILLISFLVLFGVVYQSARLFLLVNICGVSHAWDHLRIAVENRSVMGWFLIVATSTTSSTILLNALRDCISEHHLLTCLHGGVLSFVENVR